MNTGNIDKSKKNHVGQRVIISVTNDSESFGPTGALWVWAVPTLGSVIRDRSGPVDPRTKRSRIPAGASLGPGPMEMMLIMASWYQSHPGAELGGRSEGPTGGAIPVPRRHGHGEDHGAAPPGNVRRGSLTRCGLGD